MQSVRTTPPGRNGLIVAAVIAIALASLACAIRTADQGDSRPKNTPPAGWLSQITGDPTVGATLEVDGWAADLEDGAPVSRVEVLLDGYVIGHAYALRGERPDVVSAMRQDGWLHSGWTARIRLDGINPGRHQLTAVAYDRKGLKGLLNGTKEIEVKPNP